MIKQSKDFWILKQNKLIPSETLAWESLFTQGSGYLQIRGSFEEKLEDSPQNIEYVRSTTNVSAEKFIEQNARWGCYIPGIYSPHPVFNNEITNLPFPLGIDLYVSGERLDPINSTIAGFSRELNLKTALLSRNMIWKCKSGVILNIKWRRIVHALVKKLILQEVVIVPDKDIEIKVVAGIDGDVRTNGHNHFTKIECQASSSGCFCAVETEGGNRVEVASMMLGNNWEGETTSKSARQVKKIKLKAGEQLILEKRSALSCDRDTDKLSAKEVLNKYKNISFEKLLAGHIEIWEERWEKSDIEIRGDKKSQLNVRASIYHLLRSYVDDDRVSICSKGYSSDAYWGRFFWDTEMYIIPFFLYTDPAKAKNLMNFRINTLPAARENARSYGYAGAKYPWEADADGKENCPGYLWQFRDHQIHISGDVIYGFLHYAYATGDYNYLKKDAAEAIKEICRYWMDRIDNVDGKSVLLAVTGPDEYNPLKNNNSFTNQIVIHSLKTGASIGKEAGMNNKEIAGWGKTAENIPILRRPDGMILQFAEFEYLAEPDFESNWKDRSKPYAEFVDEERIYRNKSSKQPDVLMMMWLFMNEFSREEIKQAWDYYEPYCTHDSSLSPGIHGIIAARLGLKKEAREYWEKTADFDFNIKNGKVSLGVHIGCLASIWQLVVFGFAGVKTAMESEILTINPVLPEGWEQVSFPLIWKGQRVKVTINHKEIFVENMSDDDLKVNICGKEYIIEALKSVRHIIQVI
jgi:kojibiose phosphorylase